MLTKRCARCKALQPTTSFYKNASYRDGLHSYCILCHREYAKENSSRSATNRASRRLAAMTRLCGGFPSCVRCGFDDLRALQIDHIDGGGCEESARLGPAGIVARIMRGEGSYQVLCANCNQIKKVENGELAGYRSKG